MIFENKKDIIFLSIFNFLLWTTLGVLAPIEVLFLDSLTQNISIKGLLIGLPGLVVLLFSPFATKIGVKFGNKKILFYLVIISIPFFIALPFSSTYQIYAVLKVLSSIIYLSTPILYVYVSKICKKPGISFGSIIMASSLGGAFGFFISGLVGDFFGLFSSYFLISFFAFISLFFIIPLKNITKSEKVVSKSEGKKSFDFLALTVFVGTFAFSLPFTARVVVWPLVIDLLTTKPAFFSGIIMASMGITAAILSIPSGLLSDKFGDKKIFFISWGILGIMGVLLYFTVNSLFLFFLFSVLFAVGEILKGPAQSAILAKYKPVFFGYRSSVEALSSLLGATFAGISIAFFGIHKTVLFMGLVILIPLIFFLIIYKIKMRN